MSIITQTKSVMANALMRYANENNTDYTQSQILICSDSPECTPSYKILKNHKILKDVTFNDLLNVKIDFLGRELVATPFIKNCIKRITKENSCNFNEVNVLVYSKDQECKKIKLYLFIGTTPTKEITFDYLFGEDF